MSYPVALRWLVIEDDDGVKDAYDSIFDDLKGDFSHLPFSPRPLPSTPSRSRRHNGV